MCGICGTFGYKGAPHSDPSVLSDMLSVIHHRGPDDQGVYLNSSLAMGMRRLSIIDLHGGKQPVLNENGSVALVFNGEIYNYKELRQSLTARGHRFTTSSDTEVIVHLYEEEGDDCVHALRGMFAFALWDVRRQRLLLARDRLGIKPLYYTEQKGGFVFASEIKAILQHPRIEARLDPQALSHYLGMKFVPAPATMFAGIRALPPGHLLSCNASGVKVHEYWRVSYSRKPYDRTSEGEYMEQLEALLRESVGLHLASDVPFGAFLSGGLDSSTVVVLMSQLLNQPVKTFSVGFAGEGAASSELPWARLVAQHCGAEHNEILIGPQDLIANAAKVVWHLDQPVADNACLANYMVSDLAVRQVKMVLTGEGGDELFAGYARYTGERLSPLFRAIPRLGRRLALDALSHLPNLRRPKLALFALCQQSEAARFASWFPLFNQEMKSLLFSDLFKSQVGDLTSESVIARHLARTDADEPLNRMLAVDTELWLPDDLLARGDKMSMAASLEARVPLLDHRVVEFAGRLPPHLKLKGMTRKYLLKKVASKWLPERIINRKKEGFPMPFAEWFRRDARTFVRDMLAPEVIRRRGFLEARYVDGLLHEHETGLADHSPLIWGLLNLELWHQTFLDVSPAVQRQQNSSIVL